MDATASDPSSPPRGQHQLQGPRPPRLAVNMESHKIKKPAVTTTWWKKSHHLQQPPQRAPVIINHASPKVINAKPGDFMAIVQRLTGHVTSAVVSSSAPVLVLSPNTNAAAAVSASARLAATERAVRALPHMPHRPPTDYGADFLDAADDADGLAAVLSLPRRPPGILSPAALPPAACSGQFSAMPFDPSCLSWLKEFTPYYSR